MATEVLEIVTGTAAFVAIKSSHYGFKGDLTAKSTNGGDILLRLASDVSGVGTPLPAGTTKVCDTPIDLSHYEIKGDTYVLILDGVTNPGW